MGTPLVLAFVLTKRLSFEDEEWTLRLLDDEGCIFTQNLTIVRLREERVHTLLTLRIDRVYILSMDLNFLSTLQVHNAWKIHRRKEGLLSTQDENLNAGEK